MPSRWITNYDIGLVCADFSCSVAFISVFHHYPSRGFRAGLPFLSLICHVSSASICLPRRPFGVPVMSVAATFNKRSLGRRAAAVSVPISHFQGVPVGVRIAAHLSVTFANQHVCLGGLAAASGERHAVYAARSKAKVGKVQLDTVQSQADGPVHCQGVRQHQRGSGDAWPGHGRHASRRIARTNTARERCDRPSFSCRPSPCATMPRDPFDHLERRDVPHAHHNGTFSVDDLVWGRV